MKEGDNILISTIMQDAPKSIQTVTERGDIHLIQKSNL